MSFRVPVFVADHPMESLLAACLLLGLLFISADGTSPMPVAHPLVTAQTGR